MGVLFTAVVVSCVVCCFSTEWHARNGMWSPWSSDVAAVSSHLKRERRLLGDRIRCQKAISLGNRAQVAHCLFPRAGPGVSSTGVGDNYGDIGQDSERSNRHGRHIKIAFVGARSLSPAGASDLLLY